MKGHEEIIKLRLLGKKPEWVFINDFPCQTDWMLHNDHATVCVDGEPIKTLDLRFVVGLKVSIAGSTEERAKALFDLCLKNGARIIAGTHIKNNLHPLDQDGWTEVHGI